MCACTTRRLYPGIWSFLVYNIKAISALQLKCYKKWLQIVCAMSTHIDTNRHTRSYPYTRILLLHSFTKTNAPGPCTSIRRYFVRLRTSTIATQISISLSWSYASVVTACVFICFVCTQFGLTNMHHWIWFLQFKWNCLSHCIEELTINACNANGYSLVLWGTHIYKRWY